jgi:hypothetical protein
MLQPGPNSLCSLTVIFLKITPPNLLVLFQMYVPLSLIVAVCVCVCVSLNTTCSVCIMLLVCRFSRLITWSCITEVHPCLGKTFPPTQLSLVACSFCVGLGWEVLLPSTLDLVLAQFPFRQSWFWWDLHFDWLWVSVVVSHQLQREVFLMRDEDYTHLQV